MIQAAPSSRQPRQALAGIGWSGSSSTTAPGSSAHRSPSAPCRRPGRRTGGAGRRSTRRSRAGSARPDGPRRCDWPSDPWRSKARVSLEAAVRGEPVADPEPAVGSQRGAGPVARPGRQPRAGARASRSVRDERPQVVEEAVPVCPPKTTRPSPSTHAALWPKRAPAGAHGRDALPAVGREVEPPQVAEDPPPSRPPNSHAPPARRRSACGPPAAAALAAVSDCQASETADRSTGTRTRSVLSERARARRDGDGETGDATSEGGDRRRRLRGSRHDQQRSRPPAAS